MAIPSNKDILWLKVLTHDDSEFARNLRNANNEYFHNSEEISIEQHNNWLNKTLKENPPTFHIIMLESNKIGTISITNHDDIATIGNVIIDKEYRGCGLGKRAMYIVMGLAISRGAKKIRLSVEYTNGNAQAFYVNLGFIERAVIMEKQCL